MTSSRCPPPNLQAVLQLVAASRWITVVSANLRQMPTCTAFAITATSITAARSSVSCISSVACTTT